MKQRTWKVFGLCFIVFAVFLFIHAAAHIQMNDSLDGTLFVRLGNGGWYSYDRRKDDLCDITSMDMDGVLTISNAGNETAWMLVQSHAEDYSIVLRNQEKTLYKETLYEKPLAVCAFQDGFLLMQKKENDAIAAYKQQGYQITANCAEIVYMDPTGKRLVLAECGFNATNPQAFFVAQGDAFTFLPPSFYVETDPTGETKYLRCNENVICVYEKGSIRELPLHDQKIDALRSGNNVIVALKENSLYLFSLQTGLNRKIANHIGQQNGVISPNGQYYLYARLHGILGDRWDTYVLDLKTKRKIKLHAIHNTGTDGFDFCWVSGNSL